MKGIQIHVVGSEQTHFISNHNGHVRGRSLFFSCGDWAFFFWGGGGGGGEGHEKKNLPQMGNESTKVWGEGVTNMTSISFSGIKMLWL